MTGMIRRQTELDKAPSKNIYNSYSHDVFQTQIDFSANPENLGHENTHNFKMIMQFANLYIFPSRII